MATIEEMGNLLIVDLQQDPPVFIDTINIGTANAFSLAFTPNSEWLIVGGSDGKMKAYEVSTGNLMLDIDAHGSEWLMSVAVAPDGSKIATCGGSQIKIWDTNGTELATFAGHPGGVSSLAFSPNSSMLYSGGKDGKVRVWQAANGQSVADFSLPGFIITPEVKAIAISKTGKHLSVADSYGRINILNHDLTESLLNFTNGNLGDPSSLAWKGDDTLLVGSSRGQLALYKIFEPGTFVQKDLKQQVSVYPNPFENVIEVGLQHTGNQLIQEVQLFDVQGRTVQTYAPAAATGSVRLEGLGSLPAGVYYLQVMFNDRKSTFFKQVK
jgi:WD40 repeat protein